MLTNILTCSSSKDVASGSLESTHDTIPPITILRSRSADFRGVPSEEGDDLSQQELSDVTEDEEDLLSAKTSKPAYKRGRKVTFPSISHGTSILQGGEFIKKVKNEWRVVAH